MVRGLLISHPQICDLFAMNLADLVKAKTFTIPH